jgi:hypothetical protein
VCLKAVRWQTEKRRSRFDAVGMTPTSSVPLPVQVSKPRPVPQSGWKSSIDRAYVQLELKEAIRLNKNIITVFEADQRKQAYFDYAKASQKYAGTEFEFLLSIDATTYRRDSYEAVAMTKKIESKSRQAALEPAVQPINAPGMWDYFLSHGQAAAGDQVMALSMHLTQAGKSVWYDMSMTDRSTPAMFEGVAQCSNFILFLSGDPDINPGEIYPLHRWMGSA